MEDTIQLFDNTHIWVGSVLDNRYPKEICEKIYTTDDRGAFITLKMQKYNTIHTIPLFIEGCR